MFLIDRHVQRGAVDLACRSVDQSRRRLEARLEDMECAENVRLHNVDVSGGVLVV